MSKSTANLSKWTFAVEPDGREIQVQAATKGEARRAAWDSMTDEQRDACGIMELVDVIVSPEADADTLTANLTAFESFAAMLAAHNNYRPSLNCNTSCNAPALRRLADLYDQVQEMRGDARRAYRC